MKLLFTPHRYDKNNRGDDADNEIGDKQLVHIFLLATSAIVR